MSSNNALIVRNFTPKFPYSERDVMLYGLGATSVHNYPNHSIVFFPNNFTSQLVIRTLHQRILGHKRLRVEYASEQNLYRLNCHSVLDADLREEIFKSQLECSSSTKHIESIDLYNSKSDASYQFPKISHSIIQRINKNLQSNQKFYYNVLLLMIHLGLDPPFDEDNPNDDNHLGKHDLSDSESELETQTEATNLKYAPYFLLKQRDRKYKKLSTGPTNQVPKQKSKTDTVTTSIEKVFEINDHQIIKPNININVSSNFPSTKADLPSNTDDGFGLLDANKAQLKQTSQVSPKKNDFDIATLNLDDIVSDSLLSTNRIPQSEWTNYSVFKNYSPGIRSHRLYLKNIHRKCTIYELYCLFGKFVNLVDQNHLNYFDIVYLDKGKMRGQAFVTFPNEDICETALKQTNGYKIMDKPIVVSFARSCK